MRRDLFRRSLAEAIGTFALVFVGTGAIIADDVSGGAVTHVGISTSFGLVVMAMIYAVGPVSGAHFNPAVSFGFWLSGRFPSREMLPYGVSQFGAALLASAALRFIFPAHATLGATLSVADAVPSIVLEAVLTFLLMFVILCVATGAKEQGIMAGAAIGATVAIGALAGGPITGASMNPARSFGPAVVSGEFGDLWLYFVGPLLGSALAVAMFGLVAPPPSNRLPREDP